MSVKNTGDLAGISQLVNMHIQFIIYGYRSNRFGITRKQRNFKLSTSKMKVKVVNELTAV